MMRIAAVAGLALVTALAAPALGEDSPFVGKWIATAETQGGEVPETLTVVKTAGGYAIDGKLVVAAPGTPEAGPGKDIVIEGGKFSYKRAIALLGGAEIAYSGVVTGDTFKGKAVMFGGEAPYNGVRVKAEK